MTKRIKGVYSVRRPVSVLITVIMLLSLFTLQAFTAPVADRPSSEFTYHGLLCESFLTSGSGANVVYTSTTPIGTYIDSEISFGTTEDLLTERCGRNDNAGFRWTGWIVPPATGVYNFRCYSDNGSRLWIGNDGANVSDALINYWNSGWWWDNASTPTSWSGDITLTAGRAYYFRLDFFEYEGGSNIRLVWRNNQGMDERLVPASAYYLPDTYTGPRISSMDISGAQLDLDIADTGGFIVLSGASLGSVTARLATSSGKDVSPLTIASQSSTSVTVAVPPGLSAGMYKIMVTGGGFTVPSPEMIFVSVAGGQVTERPEHPRPDWKRERWMNLNGWWDFNYDPAGVGLSENWQVSHGFTQKINVPFGWTTELSGVTNTGYRGEAWYQKTFVIDENWTADGKQVYAYFGAVDNWARVFINGNEVQLDTPQYYFGSYIKGHRGGYTPIEFNLTPYLKAPGEENKLTVWVEDKAIYGQHSYVALVGKQGREAPCGYNQTGGIWQSVILESRGQTSLGYVHANPKVNSGAVNGSVVLDVEINNKYSATAQNVTVDFEFTPKVYNVKTGQDEVTGATITGTHTFSNVPAGQITEYIGALEIQIPNQKLWDDVTPNLYYGTATLKIGGQVADTVSLYFGQREIDIRVQGQDSSNRNYSYININGRPVYLSGLLDQGFWIEGLYTAPSEAALRYDIESMKDRGFNMIRKHLKVEDPLEYTWADKLGFFVWQDIPHANAMMVNQYSSSDTYAPGRDIYLDCLDAALRRDYNRPSVIAIMLFNETWGITRGSAAAANNTHPVGLKQSHTFNVTNTTTRTLNADTRINSQTENNWLAALYFHVKEVHPGKIVEDMSPCNNDHLNPTDINTWHDYSKGYTNVNNVVTGRENTAYPGSTNNYRSGFQQTGQPILNSEYGSVGYGDWDYDISWCFKYYTDVLRQQVKHGGYVYTEPHDIENERNGILTWERYDKIMGYEDVAWGGDMSIADLNQPNYVGISGNPITTVTPGSTFTRNAVAMNWSGNSYPGATLKWRFDATDGFGNNITTGLSGSYSINYTPYVQRTQSISFALPGVRCVGTLTVWIEDSAGNKLAKNFQNVLVRPGGASMAAEVAGDSSYILRQSSASSNTFTNTSGSGQTVYNFAVPSDFDPANLNHIRLLAEISSIKPATAVQDRYLPTTNSDGSQTAKGKEKPSDMTVYINGHEADTLYIPDNPRDTRATQALGAFVSGASAGNFGYLVNLNLSDALISTLKAELATNKTISITFGVKTGAANRNGLRVYNETNGRWAVTPTLLINPTDEYAVGSYATDIRNYSVETALSAEQQFTVRGGVYAIAYEGGQIVLKQGANTLGAVDVAGNSVAVRVQLFDTRIMLWVNDDPDPAFYVYDKTPATSGNISGSGLTFVISPETYESSGAGVPEPQAEVNIVECFNNGANIGAANRYTATSGGSSSTWTYCTSTTYPNTLQYTSSTGGKVQFANSVITDGVAEVDITLASGTDTGNTGLLVRSSNYTGGGTDNVYGYYIGIGRNNNTGTSNTIAAGRTFLQIGRMQNNWTQLHIVALSTVSVSYPIRHRLSVSMVGSRFEVYVDGELRATFYDSTFASGSVGLRTFNAAGYADNLVISTAPRYSNSFTATTPGSDATLANFTGHATIINNVWSISSNRLAASGAGAALIGNYGWSDYEYSATIRPTNAASVAGLVLRGFSNTGSESGYVVALNRPEGKIQLLRSAKGVRTVLAEENFAFSSNNTTDYPLTVRVVNNTIRVYANVNGSTGVVSTAKPVLTVVDNLYPTGMAGVINIAGTAAFDDLNIKDKFVWQEDFNDGTLSGWKTYGNGTATVADNELTLIQNSNGYKIVGGYATWENYTIKADIKLLTRAGKSNGGFTYLSTEFGSSQDDLRGYVTGVNYNEVANPSPGEHTGVETGAIHYGWTALTNTTAGAITFDPSEWHPMVITVTSTGAGVTNIKAWVDGHMCYDYNAPANRDFHYGQIAARVFNSDMKVRNLRVIPSGLAEPIIAFGLSGKVLTGASVANDLTGVTVNLYSSNDTAFETPLFSTTAAADGSYAFDAVPDGKYKVQVPGQNGRFATSTSSVVDVVKNTADVNITLIAVKSELEITKIPGRPLSATVVLDSAVDAAAGASIILAFYDARGKMISMTSSTETIAAGGTLVKFEVSASVIPENTASMSAFIWSSEYIPQRTSKSVSIP